MILAKKIDGKYLCRAETWGHQKHCEGSVMDKFDDGCPYNWPGDECKIGEQVIKDFENRMSTGRKQ